MKIIFAVVWFIIGTFTIGSYYDYSGWKGNDEKKALVHLLFSIIGALAVLLMGYLFLKLW